MIIKAIAIDDEPKALQVIENHVARVPFLVLEKTFVDPFKAVAWLNDNQIDLLFLDINMPDIDGIQLLKILKNPPLVVFTTAHSEYALESYELAAVDYLLKPFDYARFLQAATRVKERLISGGAGSGEFFFVNTGSQRRRVEYTDIHCIEGQGNYVNYFTASGNFLVRATIRETLELLPATRFMQVHRSWIVSLKHIDKVEDNHVFVGKQMISLGPTYRDNFLKVIDSLNK